MSTTCESRGVEKEEGEVKDKEEGDEKKGEDDGKESERMEKKTTSDVRR